MTAPTSCFHDWDPAKLVCRTCGTLGRYDPRRKTTIVPISCAACVEPATIRSLNDSEFYCEHHAATWWKKRAVTATTDPVEKP